jgi:hypothetical protein
MHSINDERYAYKADRVIVVQPEEGSEIKLMILETSSTFIKASNTKISHDHHKAVFGRLLILKTLANEYQLGGISYFSKIKVF